MVQESIEWFFRFVDAPPDGLATDAILFQLCLLYAKLHAASKRDKRLQGLFHEAQYAAFQCCSQESCKDHTICRTWFLDPRTHLHYAKVYLGKEHYILAQDSIVDAANLGWKMDHGW